MNEELERIRTEYTRRDAAGTSDLYSYTNPAFQYHIQEREQGLMRMLRRAGVELSAADVLEIGCGTGHILQRFLDFGTRSVVGVDLMPHRVAMGHAKYPAVRMVCGDAGDLPFASESFGLVAQFMCLSSVLDSSLRVRIAQEMWRVVSPGGVIVSYDMRPSSVLRRSIFYCTRHLNGARPGKASAHAVTPTQPVGIDELRRLFPAGRMDVLPLSLDFKLAAVAGISWLIASSLSSIPALRTHWLSVIRKPEEAKRGG
jgi:SAM-dependent methyltransferase